MTTSPGKKALRNQSLSIGTEGFATQSFKLLILRRIDRVFFVAVAPCKRKRTDRIKNYCPKVWTMGPGKVKVMLPDLGSCTILTQSIYLL